MEDLEDGALGESHLRRLSNGDGLGFHPHGLSLKLMAEELEGCPDKSNLVEIGPGPGVTGLEGWQEVWRDVR